MAPPTAEELEAEKEQVLVSILEDEPIELESQLEESGVDFLLDLYTVSKK